MILKTIKFIGRVIYVTKLFIITKKKWSLKIWLSFWFSNKQSLVPIGKYRFFLRSKNFFIKLSDLSMILEILHFNEYGQAKIKEGDTVIDIGAHIGTFSVMASSKVAKKNASGKVYSFEPFKSTFNVLKKNKEINNRKNLNIINKAVSDTVGSVEFYVNDINYAENSLNKISNKSISVKTTTLDSFFSEKKIKRCNLLKIDCEGAEYAILTSSKKAIKKIDQIILEYHNPEYFNIDNKYSLKKLVAYLKDNGFLVNVQRTHYYQGNLYAKKIEK